MTIEQAKPRPMSEAPRDGTVILVFHKDQAWAFPVTWSEDGWIEPVGFYPEASGEIVGWLPCPTYTGEAVK